MSTNIMARSLVSLVSLVSLGLVGCGDDPLDPGAGNDSGSGTNTLRVEGRAFAEPRIVDAKEDDFDTSFEINVSLNGQDVAAGTVRIKSRFATTDLTYNATKMHWEGTAAGYDRVYQLDVIAGNDEVTGVIVDGPDLHRITSPAPGASMDSTIANMLEWDRAGAADIITFRADEIDRITITDSGSYSIPPGSMKAEKDKTRENTLELRRENRVSPAGAVAGSTFSVGVEQYVVVLALPDPTL